jgi:hypothetical protein
MADNVAITAGSGTSVATDDVSGVHYQYVKLADGAADSSAKIGGDATNGLDVDVTRVQGSVTVANGGTFVTQENGSALTALQLIDDPVIADDATVTAGTTKVMMAGGMAVAHGSNPDAADAGDGGMLLMNRHRVQFTIGGHPNAKSATYITTASGTDDNVMAAISSGTKYAVTRITITLDEATTVGVAVRLGFGTANVPALGASQADAVDDILVYHPGLVPGGGITIGDGSGVLGVGGDGAELRITNEVPTGGTLAVTITYFSIES